MAKDTIKTALKLMVLNVDLYDSSREDALNALIEIERNQATEEQKSFAFTTNTGVWANHFAEFRQHRREKDSRILTIKLVREKLQCGLSEALIIVKGIETQDGLNKDEIPF